MVLMNPMDSSVAGSRLDITLKWDDIRICIITCSALLHHHQIHAMKSLIQRFLPLVAFSLLVLFAAVHSPAFGADIVWSSPTTISGDGDVSTDGSLVAAFNTR